MPRTGFAHHPDKIDDLIKNVGGAPVVIKLLEGTQGIGVVLAHTQETTETIIEACMRLNADTLVQEYIKEAGGADVRCLVVSGKFIAAMKRQAAKGEFRSNLNRGGSASIVKLSPAERKAAINAAKTMELNMGGVDILRSNSGPVVIEVNSSPVLVGIETATGKDVARMIIQFLEKNAKPNSNKTRGRG
jgi:ribosomal protein S6--L-glutamate ligase